MIPTRPRLISARGTLIAPVGNHAEPVPRRPDEEERIETGTFTLEEARAMMARGEIREDKTLVALLLEGERQTTPSSTPLPGTERSMESA